MVLSKYSPAERLLRKRLAARLRQQRCRARKRVAAKKTEDANDADLDGGKACCQSSSSSSLSENRTDLPPHDHDTTQRHAPIHYASFHHSSAVPPPPVRYPSLPMTRPSAFEKTIQPLNPTYPHDIRRQHPLIQPTYSRDASYPRLCAPPLFSYTSHPESLGYDVSSNSSALIPARLLPSSGVRLVMHPVGHGSTPAEAYPTLPIPPLLSIPPSHPPPISAPSIVSRTVSREETGCTADLAQQQQQRRPPFQGDYLLFSSSASSSSTDPTLWNKEKAAIAAMLSLGNDNDEDGEVVVVCSESKDKYLTNISKIHTRLRA